jgi:hypothetical protein
MSTYAPPLTVSDTPMLRLAAGRGRARIVASTLGISAAAVAAVLLFRPWQVRNSFAYAELAPVRDAVWTAIFIDALAFLALAISAALSVALVARGRGARLADIGAVITIAGGALFAMGAFAFVALVWLVTDTSVLAPADGARVIEAAMNEAAHVVLPQALGFLLYTAGTLILAAALFRSRAVPRWLPIAIVVATLLQFGFHDRVLDFVQIGGMALWLVLAGLLLVREPTETAANARPGTA